ncbi:MAG: glycosyltransferase [Nostoc sp.]|uniref:glycosyltransferase n=1 Tax=Nostoc sp. TaxID=1180 RepID=UPI002FF64F5C
MAINSPLVSVVMTTYNHEKYIAEAIDSVLNQTFTNFELIIVNDGSSDRTDEVIRSFQDSRIVYIHQENQGTSVAVNQGIIASRGKYIALMSGDDICYPQRLEKQYQYLNTNNKKIIFSGVDFIDDESHLITEKHFARNYFIYSNKPNAEILNYFFMQGNYLCAVTAFLEKNILFEAGLFNLASIQLQDFDMWIKLVKKYDVLIIEDKLVKYRIRNNDDNLSHPNNSARSIFEQYQIYRNIFDDVNIELFRKAFGKNIRKGNFKEGGEYELEKAFLYLSHSSSLIQSIGCEKLSTLLQDKDILSVAKNEYNFSLPDLYKLTNSIDISNSRKIQQTQAELENLQSQLERTQGELERSHSHLQLTQGELERSHSQLELTQGELEQVQSELKQTQTQLENLQINKWGLFIKAAFDTPIEWKQQSSNICFSGWCFHPQLKVTKLTLSYGKIVVDCTYGYPRKDVGQAYPQCPNSINSGFVVTINVPSGRWQIALNAYLESGEVITFQPSQVLVVYRFKFLHNWKLRFQQLVKFTNLISKRIVERRRRLGRLATLGELPLLARRAINLYKQQKSLDSDLTTLPPSFLIPQSLDAYDAWLGVNKWHERSLTHLTNRLKTAKTNLPKISVVMPVFNPQIAFLESAIASVINQVYENWELCIADDHSTDPAVHLTLNRWAASDVRIRVVFREENGNISAATNSAATLADADYLVFLDHDDELTPDALGEVALYLAEHPETDFLYSDDDKIDTNGSRFAPQFKPDWSPELLLSYMYLSHLCVVRRSIFDQIGGLRIGFEGSQDYDFALRATEISHHVGHLPLVLYHWRAVPGSTAISGSAKPASFTSGQNALQEALERRGISGIVYHPDWAAKAGCGIFEYQFTNQGPSVTIIIPTKNQLALLQACLNSLKKTTYKNYQIVVIDNESDDPKTLTYLDQIPHQVLRIGNGGAGFNFAAINNRAAEQIDSDYLLFLNNDTEVISPQWLSQMMGFALFQGVGSVGARLLYPDQSIQHAGIIHGLYHGLAGPTFKNVPSWDCGYLSYAKVNRNYSAVTAACMLTPRQLFLELGGFDEEQFAVAYNDVDYCYRLVEKGYRCVYCSTAELLHKEGASRGFRDNPREPAAFKRKYNDKVDPWYSPHLSLNDEQFKIQPRRVVLGSIQPIKTLVFTHNLNWEGAPYSQYEVTVKLKEMGIIDPIIYSPEDGPLRTDYETKGIPVYLKQHPLKNVSTNRDYNQAISALAEFIQELEVEIIYANTLQTFYAIATAKNLGIPSIWNVRESEPWQTYFNDFGEEIATRALECFRFPYRVVFVANATRDRYLALNSHHNFTVIHNGLNLQRLEEKSKASTKEKARKLLNVSEDEVVLLLLGTVCERKGQHDLALALAKLSQEWHGKVKVFIVGDRPSTYSTELKNLVTQLPEAIRRKMNIIPETPDIAQYYQAADIFILTSRIESFPRVILEAMAYGLPIITTPVFGVKEQVQPGNNAIFYEPGNLQELTEAIVYLLQDEKMRSRFADNSRHVLACLNNFEDMVQNYAQIFREAYFK